MGHHVVSIRHPIIHIYHTYIYIYTSPPIGVVIIQSSLPHQGRRSLQWLRYGSSQFHQQPHAHAHPLSDVYPRQLAIYSTKLISNQFQSNNEESATLLQKEATRNLAGENKIKVKVQTAKDLNPTKAKASTHMRWIDIHSAKDAWLPVILAGITSAAVVPAQGQLTIASFTHAVTFLHRCISARSYGLLPVHTYILGAIHPSSIPE